ncbi:SEL1-like repeat protein [Aquitalea pelogenes]|uniref:SEL1-like repeat protein n=1 Tax=Aquitalea pelogenes TaxID=1293573 RepID=UPI0035B277DF
MRLFFYLPLSLCLLGCQAKPEHAMPDVSAVHAKLAFTCAYEKDRLPPLNPEAEQLFRYGRWLWRGNIVTPKPAVYADMARYYRIAAAYGHYKANFNLQNLYSQGVIDGDIEEMLDLNDALIKAGIPVGYYLLGHYVEGGVGYDANKELALKYFRKAADLGNKEAQYYVGDRLTRLTISELEAFNIGRQMKRCAAEQGHGEAAQEAGIDLQSDKHYAEAIKYYQLGTKAGDYGSASWLADGFKQTGPADPYYYLGVAHDAERARRYDIISTTLQNYAYANPSVPELDSIVPLPPAPLPPWDGKIQWLKDREANIPPPQPSEALMTRLAEAKALDPATGRPDPKRQQAQKAQAAQAKVLPLGTTRHTGESCPQSGIWHAQFPPHSISNRLPGYDVQRFFAQGSLLPPLPVHYPRLLGRWLGYPAQVEPVRWILMEYA